MSLYTIGAILVLDGEGKRLVAKYYNNRDFPTTKEQLAFEKNLFSKTQKANAEIIMFDNVIAVYRNVADVMFYVLGGYEENELVLLSILNAFYDVISILLRNVVDRRAILENLDYVLLALDELVDGGIILESDATVIAARVAMKGADSETPLSEQTISQALQSAKDQIARSLLKS